MRLAKQIFLTKISIFFGIMAIAGFIMFENRPIVVENNQAVVTYHLIGGAMKDLHLKANQINPFFSAYTGSETGGHFLSFSTDNNSDPLSEHRTKVIWELTNSPILKSQNLEYVMRADFLNDKISVKRSIKLDTASTGIAVREEFYNYDNKELKLNISQNISLNPDFMEDFNTYSNIDLQHHDKQLKKKDKSSNSSDGIALAWIGIVDKRNHLLLGYFWNKQDYSVVELEHENKSYTLRLKEGKKGDTLASKSTRTKSYYCYIIAIPQDFAGIETVRVIDESVTLVENSNKRIYPVSKSLIIF